jgi:hypothetical protein
MLMPVNSDKPHLWKADVTASVDQFNRWFMLAAPQAFRDSRNNATAIVEAGVRMTKDLANIDPIVLRANPEVLKVLRMASCPPLARDRLAGLAGVSKSLVKAMEERGKIPPRAKSAAVDDALARLASVFEQLLDFELFPWLGRVSGATDDERYRASTIVADRLCGALSDPIIRNAQERRQLELIAAHLIAKGYRQQAHPANQSLVKMAPGSFAFRHNVTVARGLKIPVDAVIQPMVLREDGLPILVEAKSAGDFTNVNKRRKEEATKAHQLREALGESVKFVLFLCGYFDAGYLGYEAAEGIDWIWEHRIGDLDLLGI